MLVFMLANTTFEAMKQNLSHIRYWQSCANEANTLADPMDIYCVREGWGADWGGEERIEESCALGEG